MVEEKVEATVQSEQMTEVMKDETESHTAVESRAIKTKASESTKAKPTTTRPKPPTKTKTKPKPKPPAKTTTKKPETNNKNKTKNKTKTSEKNKPRAKGILYGLSSLRRSGDVAVSILADHTTVKSNFAVGPLVLKVEKEVRVTSYYINFMVFILINRI